MNDTCRAPNLYWKMLWDLEKPSYHIILAGRQELVIVNSKKKRAEYWTLTFRLTIKLKESEKKDKYLDLAGEL